MRREEECDLLGVAWQSLNEKLLAEVFACKENLKKKMPHPRSRGPVACCRHCRKEFNSLPAILSHLGSSRCQPQLAKLYQGKAVQSGSFSMATEPSPTASDGKSVVQARDNFLDWSTQEYVEGRPWGPLRLSSAKQVIGSVNRFLNWSDGEPLHHLTFHIEINTFHCHGV